LKNQTRQIIKNVIEENVVAFKENAAKLMYSKVGQKLQDQYKIVAQNLMRPKQ
jgi:hypothetical protein